MTEKEKKIHDLSEILSLAPEKRNLLLQEKGINSVEMLISLSSDPVVRKDLKHLLEIEDDDFDKILLDAKALCSEAETARLCSKREFPYQMGALFEEENKTSETKEQIQSKGLVLDEKQDGKKQ